MLKSISRDSKDEGESFTRQGSLRKVLPSGHNKGNLFGRQNEDLNKFYKKFHQEYIILAEYNMIKTENIKSVYVIPSRETSLLWFGVVFVRTGLYEDGVFRFNIYLDENFPDSKHPKVVFQSDVFHPVIDEKSRELNLLGGFPLWSKNEQHIWQILKYIHWIFHNVTSSCQHVINTEALNLLRTNEDAFKERIKHCVQTSREKLYERPVDDKHYITFEEYTPHMHDPVRLSMLQPIADERAASLGGHSWVKAGTYRPLTRQPSMNMDS